MKPWKSLSANVNVGVNTNGWTLATPPAGNNEKPRVFRYAVHFTLPFEATPVVHLGLTGFDLDQRDYGRLTLTAKEITKAGFVAELATWRETRVYNAAFSWLALGA